MHVQRALGIVLLSSLPLVSYAEVVISEIAWMGTNDSHTDEWIELHNTGTRPAVLDGWILSNGSSLHIPLAGTLGAGEHAVLERTDDNTAPGSAFLIYKGALSNQGETLTLKRANGQVEDEIVSGAGWKHIGGNNSTKETAQRIEDGWQTAPPTPGEENVPLPAPELTAEPVASSASAFASEPIMLAQAISGKESTRDTLPYFALIAVLIAAILAVYERGRKLD